MNWNSKNNSETDNANALGKNVMTSLVTHFESKINDATDILNENNPNLDYSSKEKRC
jgi:hypothetical protein